jgi:hypothetical protein
LLYAVSIAAAGETPADLVQTLVRAGFPEVTGPRFTYRWRFSPTLVEVFHQDASEQPATSRRILSIEVLYDGQSRLRHVGFSGEITEEAANGRLLEVLTAHPNWAATDVAQWLRNDKAEFGPDRVQQFRSQLNLNPFERLFGPLTVASVDFDWKFDHPELGSDNVKPPVWRVAAHSQRRAPFACYVLLFEPYHARLKAVLPSVEACSAQKSNR